MYQEKINLKELPDNPTLLKEIIKTHVTTIHEYQKKLEENKATIIILNEKLKLLQEKIFGKKSEKWKSEDEAEQRYLFNEAELGLTELEKEQEKQEEVTKQEVKGYTRINKEKNTGGKIVFPADIPREKIIHEGTVEEKQCPCCKEDRPILGKKTREELTLEPLMFKVIEHVKIKYGSCKCEEFKAGEHKSIVTAKEPARLLPGTQIDESVVAFILTSKFCDALPFYRQEQIFRIRYNLKISRDNMCRWSIKVGYAVDPLLHLMWLEVQKSQFVQMDETTVQVLNEKNREATKKSYMWVTIGYPEYAKPVIIYSYFQNRTGKVPKVLLKDYQGYLQTDGYKGYNAISANVGVHHVGCWAHARRNFIEAEKLAKNNKSIKVALSYINNLYLLENKLRSQWENREITEEDFIVLRKEAVLPLFEKFYEWLNAKKLQVIPKSKFGEAINYTIREWPRLIRYVEASYITPDNNRCENAIRPFVVGRKNWLFFDIPEGAYASAAIYSLIETAKANNLEPYHYLKYLFKKLPLAKNQTDLESLLPYNLTSGMLII